MAFLTGASAFDRDQILREGFSVRLNGFGGGLGGGLLPGPSVGGGLGPSIISAIASILTSVLGRRTVAGGLTVPTPTAGLSLSSLCALLRLPPSICAALPGILGGAAGGVIGGAGAGILGRLFGGPRRRRRRGISATELRGFRKVNRLLCQTGMRMKCPTKRCG